LAPSVKTHKLLSAQRMSAKIAANRILSYARTNQRRTLESRSRHSHWTQDGFRSLRHSSSLIHQVHTKLDGLSPYEVRRIPQVHTKLDEVRLG